MHWSASFATLCSQRYVRCIIIAWINSLSVKSFFCVVLHYVKCACVRDSELARLSQQSFHRRLANTCARTRIQIVSAIIYNGISQKTGNVFRGSGWWLYCGLLLRKTSPLFDVLLPLFIVTAQKRTELKNTVSHIIFPLTRLVLSTVLSLYISRWTCFRVSTLQA